MSTAELTRDRKSMRDNQPSYIKMAETQKGIINCIIFEGNIHDIYPVDNMYEEGAESGVCYDGINQLLYSIYEGGHTRGKYNFLFCHPLKGFCDVLNLGYTEELVSQCDKLLETSKNEKNRLNNHKSKRDNSDGIHEHVRTAERINQALTKRISVGEEEKSVCVVVDYASRYLLSNEAGDSNEQEFFLWLQDAVTNAIRCNGCVSTLILLVDRLSDLPSWFVQNNPHILALTIPNPDTKAREMYMKECFEEFATMEQSTSDELKKTYHKAVQATDGMKLIGLDNIRRMYVNEGTSISELPDIISRARYGFKENAWSSIKENIGEDIVEILEKRVKGQRHALEKVSMVLKRAVAGISGIHHSNGASNKPKGVLLFVGPTGSGKTETAKSMAELLFGEQDRIIRLDLGEYTEENSVHKILGAPPGYVGYQNGGQLTNAVKNNPMSIVLFDELEKAHAKVFDTIMQIIEDGRLTDSFGCTVSFANTIIIFTSNAGMATIQTNPMTGERVKIENVQPDDTFEDIEKAAKKGLQASLKPEFLNRIGENVVTFNYIDEENTRAIISSKIEDINMLILKNLKIDVSLSDSQVYDLLFKLSWVDDIRKYCGRGITNILEDKYVNVLSEYIYDHNCTEGCKLKGCVVDGKVTFEEVE